MGLLLLLVQGLAGDRVFAMTEVDEQQELKLQRPIIQ